MGNQPSDINPVNQTRSYAAPAYLFPNEERGNLKVLTGALVEKINWAENSSHYGHSWTKSGGNGGGVVTAQGVTFSAGGKLYVVNATKEVIVSGGSVNTPQLLELSGIGSASVLSKAGVKQVIDLPNV